MTTTSGGPSAAFSGARHALQAIETVAGSGSPRAFMSSLLSIFSPERNRKPNISVIVPSMSSNVAVPDARVFL